MSKTARQSLVFLGVIIGLRLLAMWYVPLTDTTEARYGEIARKMVETGDWITLWHDYGVPFWAKPPLSTWLSSASMQLFGINELAARLPALFMALAVCGLLLGMIWPYLLAGASPWIVVVIPYALRQRLKKQSTTTVKLTEYQKYLWCWLLAPLLFFTFAHNIIPTYTLTALPALAFLIAQTLAPHALHKDTIRPWVFVTGMATPLILVIAIAVSYFSPHMGKHSGKEISQLYAQNTNTRDSVLDYIGERLYSMDFYNAGKARRFDTLSDFFSQPLRHNATFLALRDTQTHLLTPDQQQRLTRLTLMGNTATYHLYQLQPETQP